MQNQKNQNSTKEKIYYARTYRRLQFNTKGSILFGLLFVLPLTVLMFLCYDEVTMLMCRGAEWFLVNACGIAAERASAEFIPVLGPVYYLSLPTKLPGSGFILANLAVSLAIIGILSMGKFKGKPLSIYLDIISVVHIMACVFFFLGRNHFTYETRDYSQLYMQQQVGIWISFLVLMGVVEGVLGRGAIIYKVGTVVSVMLYSFLFGLIRYGLFLWILDSFSILYMPIMFFALGPFFDFMYFVMFYSISANRMIKKNNAKSSEDWRWT